MAIVEKPDLLEVTMPGMDWLAVCQLFMLTRNSGSHAHLPSSEDLLDASDRSMVPMVVEKEPWIESPTGEDKGARAHQTSGEAGFEVTGLDEALEEQLGGCTVIGVEVSFATANGTEGFAIAGHERLDLIIMDLSLPGIDGWEATRRIKANVTLPHIPIVALSSNAATTSGLGRVPLFSAEAKAAIAVFDSSR